MYASTGMPGHAVMVAYRQYYGMVHGSIPDLPPFSAEFLKVNQPQQQLQQAQPYGQTADTTSGIATFGDVARDGAPQPSQHLVLAVHGAKEALTARAEDGALKHQPRQAGELAGVLREGGARQLDSPLHLYARALLVRLHRYSASVALSHSPP